MCDVFGVTKCDRLSGALACGPLVIRQSRCLPSVTTKEFVTPLRKTMDVTKGHVTAADYQRICCWEMASLVVPDGESFCNW